MVLSLSISSDAESRLRAKAAAAGVDIETYAARYLEAVAGATPSLSQISGAVGEDFAKSGISEEELSDLLEVEKHAMRAELRNKRPA